MWFWLIAGCFSGRFTPAIDVAPGTDEASESPCASALVPEPGSAIDSLRPVVGAMQPPVSPLTLEGPDGLVSLRAIESGVGLPTAPLEANTLYTAVASHCAWSFFTGTLADPDPDATWVPCGPPAYWIGRRTVVTGLGLMDGGLFTAPMDDCDASALFAADTTDGVTTSAGTIPMGDEALWVDVMELEHTADGHAVLAVLEGWIGPMEEDCPGPACTLVAVYGLPLEAAPVDFVAESPCD